MSGAAELDAVVATLRAAPKYRTVADAVLRRVARAALAIERRPADAVKRAKSRLHQIHAAFAPAAGLAAAARATARLDAAADGAAIEASCREVLASHASTRERRGDLHELYHELFARTGPPRSVLDLGCGLHPFALPFMALPREVPYHAIDLDLRLLAPIETLFRRLGQSGTVRAIDLLGDEPLPAGDVALLLKLLPTLERQEEGAAGRLLDRVDARVLVLSFATRSIGGGARGRERHYAELARSLLAPRGLEPRRFVLGAELFFVVEPPRPARA